jgi:long-chain acyl-CoA synthetase
VRRRFIAEKYQTLIGALYGGQKTVHINAQVKYEDGRSGSFSADLQIAEAKTFSPAQTRKAA